MSLVSTSWSKLERWLVISLVFIWISHFIQVFVPETGFDAIWYHLPLVKYFATSHTIAFWSAIPQSVSPLLGDLIYLPFFNLAGSLGTKIGAFFIALLLLTLTYTLARRVMNHTWSLVTLLLVSLIQPLAWQSASFYTDTLKAIFELGMLYCLILIDQTIQQKKKQDWSNAINYWLILAGLCFGASLATKAFSLLLIPIVLVMLFVVLRWQWRWWVVFSLSTIMVAAPFYVYSYLATHQLIYTVSLHVSKLDEIGGQAKPLTYLLARSVALVISPIKIVLVRDYVSPLVLFTVPVAIWLVLTWKKQSQAMKLLALFTLGQWLVWWFVPPLSTRYALAGFITLLIIIVQALSVFIQTFPRWRWVVIGVIICSIIVALMPRMYVNLRSFKYLSGQQTQAEYLTQFLDGNIDQHLRAWYGPNLDQTHP